jgi:hypothetical protein
MADVAPAAFSDAAFHPSLEGGEDAFMREPEGHQLGKGKFNHDGWSADHRIRIVIFQSVV